MYYTTVLVDIVEGYEHTCINEAISLGLSELSEEAKVPVELVSVASVYADTKKVCMVIMAKPAYQNRLGF